ncbi:multiple sugar transport system substrate-binding protein [Pseudonocardia hierapolitana]|uniref:Multiple sugar transport system substrate-binding protein n=1 Tax=Pseudonocardia hierapolitana TaxID=1128676 RepID=A0A561SS09_9PSEU|nr:extracellular solute-binding protein [Pseudonocardia hierapolitana]TWF77631.1 multiple sugar transport system substrate-binding protein [Pseudonocardia hierapolitana]
MIRSRSTLAAASVALAMALSACSGGDGGGGGGGGETCDGPLTLWTWVPNIQAAVDLYEQSHPGVDVQVSNVGQGDEHYTQLRTVLSAGTGAPDAVQMEFKNIPAFTLTESLVDLTQYGAADVENRFLPSAWQQVKFGDGIYGIPQDTGPMIMLYRPDIFDGLGIPVPTTWDEYIEAGRKIQASGPDRFIGHLGPDDAGGVSSLLWQAGARPFELEGESSLTIDFSDEGTATWVRTFNTLVSERLVEPVPGFTDEWYRGMAEGRFATWVAGAWAPTFLQTVIPQAEGQWRVAPMPNYGEPVVPENGGSSVAVTTQSECPAAAAEFAIWLNSDPAAAKALNETSLLYPATRALVEDPAWLAAPMPFLGGQQANQVYVEASKQVSEGWQYTPFQDYTESVFPDTIGQAIVNRTDLQAGLDAWGERLRAYATEQGFQVQGS